MFLYLYLPLLFFKNKQITKRRTEHRFYAEIVTDPTRRHIIGQHKKLKKWAIRIPPKNLEVNSGAREGFL